MKEFLYQLQRQVALAMQFEPGDQARGSWELQMTVDSVIRCPGQKEQRMSTEGDSDYFKGRIDRLVQRQMESEANCDLRIQLTLTWIYSLHGESGEDIRYRDWVQWTEKSLPWRSLAETFANNGMKNSRDENELVRTITFTLVPFS
jgi:hypothetical protein